MRFLSSGSCFGKRTLIGFGTAIAIMTRTDYKYESKQGTNHKHDVTHNPTHLKLDLLIRAWELSIGIFIV